MVREIAIVCEEPAARTVYTKAKEILGLSDADFDSGYKVINYAISQDVYLEGATENKKIKGSRKIQCEAIWETALNKLDEYGEKAKWQEDSAKAENEQQRDAISRYQRFRAVLEGQLQRPVPWVLQAPIVGVPDEKKRKRLAIKAEKVRDRVFKAIERLNFILKNVEQKERERRLIIGLFWFVYIGNSIPFEAEKSLQVNRLDDFVDYLARNGGGLGMSKIKEDMPFEGTALEAVSKGKGYCTEKSKVLYAALRMAGIKAFFVEPRLTLNYFINRNELDKLGDPPLSNHFAVGVEGDIESENGKRKISILDMSQGMLVADYAEKYDYWRLSLRHYFMVDLSNLGIDLEQAGNLKKAKASYELTLRMGMDSTASNAASNYASFLMEHRNFHPPKGSRCGTIESCADIAYRVNSRNIFVAYTYAMNLADKARLLLSKGRALKAKRSKLADEYFQLVLIYVTLALEYYVKVIRQDTRFLRALGQAIKILDAYARAKTKVAFEDCWKRFSAALQGALTPQFQEILKETIQKLPKGNLCKELQDKIKQLAEELGRRH